MKEPKSAEELERQQLFNELRHYFSTRCNVPCYLEYKVMKDWLCHVGEWKGEEQ